jgi:hypothetical protein
LLVVIWSLVGSAQNEITAASGVRLSFVINAPAPELLEKKAGNF